MNKLLIFLLLLVVQITNAQTIRIYNSMVFDLHFVIWQDGKIKVDTVLHTDQQITISGHSDILIHSKAVRVNTKFIMTANEKGSTSNVKYLPRKNVVEATAISNDWREYYYKVYPTWFMQNPYIIIFSSIPTP